MYVLSGKGSVAGVDLAACVLAQCQHNGVLWDSDLPEYTLDFATQVPSVSKSIRDGHEHLVVDALNRKLQQAEAAHDTYMLLCLTAHRLIPQLHTRMQCVNLWDCVNPALDAVKGPIAFLGTHESLPHDDQRFVVLPDHVDCISDLIASVKRGYARLGENYAAHPRHLLERLIERFRQAGATTFFLGCTDLHACKQYLTDFGVPAANIISIVDIATEAVVKHANRQYTTAFQDEVSNARTHLRYKYVTRSDAPQTETKTRYFNEIVETLPSSTAADIRILDIGGSSTGHSLRLARQLTQQPCHITLLDISAASLDAARPLYAAAAGVTTTFVHGSIEAFAPDEAYDGVLCLGVLLCVSDDDAFQSEVHKIARLMKPGALLLTRDCLTSEDHKLYMAFGGVIRNREMYDRTFAETGLEVFSRNEFVIDEPIRRDIVTTVWRRTRLSTPRLDKGL
jgi:2-polyprenyl-3-methyl-5-hydroxy-6-metoxy-1,4-benzoquinol methylase/aspartate/glutamate racemase